MKDYYKILGVDKAASKEDIKKAFRKLAHQYHPDKTKNDAAAADKFKEASEAYSVLSDDAKRRQYDTFGSAGPGFNPGAQGAGFGGAGGFGGFDFSQFAQNFGGAGGFNGQGGIEFDLGDLFGEFFGGGRRPRRGRNINVDVEITFKESVFGTEKEIAVDKERLSVKIPPGIENNQGLRIAGKGEDGPAGRGDLIVRVWVTEHPSMRKEGFNLITEVPVKLSLALAGGIQEIDTLDGKLEVKIPAGTAHGDMLRVKGKGVPYETRGMITGAPHGKRGDLIIVISIIMPKKLSKNAQRLVEELKKEGI